MKTKEGFMLRTVAGRDIVVAVGAALVDFDGLISLNETGSFLWKELEKGVDYDTLLSRLLQEYDTDEATARAGIDSFLDNARKAGLIEE